MDRETTYYWLMLVVLLTFASVSSIYLADALTVDELFNAACPADLTWTEGLMDAFDPNHLPLCYEV